VNRVVCLNREFRKRNWLTIKDELGLELLDYGASRVFAVADHQLAHIYVNDPGIVQEVRQVVESLDGVDRVLEGETRKEAGLDHERAGDLVAVSHDDAWFAYYYWLDDSRAPDFARCVDIHRKPGYDPVELFLDPGKAFVKGRIAWRLLKKALGFRMLMDVIPLDPSLVRGSHGAIPRSQDDWPVIMGDIPGEGAVDSTEVFQLLQQHVLSS